MAESTSTTLFFACEVHAPWPNSLPPGRHLEAKARHLTLAFLGKTERDKLLQCLNSVPPLNFKLGFAGQFDQCLFLPPRHPHVVSYHIEWLTDPALLLTFREELIAWSASQGAPVDTRHPLLPHVTIARSPFVISAWKKHFVPLPCFVSTLHLYESLGHSKYSSLHSWEVIPPFEAIEHTADLAFRILGADLNGLFTHAALALCFSFPPLLAFVPKPISFTSLDEVIIALNGIVSAADAKIGAPFKGVSFHGNLTSTADLLIWQMIVDV